MASFSLAALVASFFAIGVAQAQTFPDVQPGDWFYSYVEDLVAMGVVNGSMSEYRPADNVNRAEMAKLVVEGFDIPLVETAGLQTFNDVPEGEWFHVYVETAYANGIVGGYLDDNGDPSGFFGPADSLTREQSAKMLVLGAPMTINTNCGPSFPDVTTNMWSYNFVETLYVNSVVDGYPDGTFGPTLNINRAEIAKMVSNAMNPVLRPCGGFSVKSAKAMSETSVEACFTQEYGDGAMEVGNYMIEDQNGDGLDVTAVAASSDPMCVDLTTEAQDPTKVYDLMVDNVMSSTSEDLIGKTATFNGYTTAEAGDLTAMLDGSSPDGTAIPKNGSNILYSVFAFEAGSNEDVEITQLVLTRAGLGEPQHFENVKIYVNGVQRGGEKTVNSTTNTATFNLSSEPIVVPAGKKTLVEARGDMDAAENSHNKLCIASSDDVLAEGVSSGEEVAVGGSFAICGEEMTTTSAEVGTLTYRVSQSSTADINVGDTDVLMTKVRLDAAEEDICVDKLMFKQQGSADAEDFANPTLVLSGSPVDADVMWEGDYLIFDLTEMDPCLEIEKGSTKNFELWVDVVGGLGNDASFDIYRDWHVEGTGQVYGYGVNVEEDSTSITPTDREIVGGNIAFSLSANNPIAGEVARGSNDHEFTRFNISTAGEAVTVRELTLTVNGAGGATASEIEDLKIWAWNAKTEQWVVVMGPDDVTAFGDISFIDSFDVPGLDTTEYIITADITNDAGDGHQFDVDVADVTDPSKTELEYTSDGDPVDETSEVSGGVLDGNVQTVADPAVDVTLAATPGNKSYVKNTLDRDLVAFDFAATTADDIKITSLTVHCAVGTGADCSDAFQSLNLYLKEGSTLTKLDGPESISSAGTDGDVDFSFTHTIEAGNSARLLVRGNVASAAGSGTYLFTIEDDADVTAEDSEGSDAVVNDGDGNYTDAFVAVGPRTITVAGNGALSNQNISDSSTVSRILIGDAPMETVLRLRFASDELEAWNVRKLQIKEINWGNDADVAKVYLKWADKTFSANLVGGIANFNLPSGSYINVPAAGNVTVDVLVDVGNVVPDSAFSGDLPQFSFDYDDNFEAVGASSSTVLTSAPSGADIDGELMRVAKSAPTVAHQPTSTALAAGSMTLYKWTVTADTTGDVAIKQFGFDITNQVSLADFKLLRNGVEVSSASTTIDIEQAGGASVEAATVAANANPTILVKWVDGSDAGEEIIPAGTTNTYELKATAGAVNANDTVSTILNNDLGGEVGDLTDGETAGETVEVDGSAVNLVWSDLSNTVQGGGTTIHNATLAASSFDWMDGFLVDGLSSLNSQVLTN
ncbi:MAG: S-layer homology domain-containing protein [Candidatus Gracilibacteria bacterium]